MSDAKFKIGKLLGEGAFGKVFLIEDKNDPSQEYAMKIMQIGKMEPEEVTLALQEIKLLSDLNHENILAYVEAFPQDGCLCIVTEFCSNGDLSDYIEKQHGTKLEELRLIEWFKQLTSAIEYMHSKNIIHRDLKVANVFLDKNMNCKLGDFGVARILESPAAMAQTQVGTYHYMSPEIFMGIRYNSKTDIWSLAVLIYELATLEKPFDALFLPMLIFKVTRGEKPEMPKGYRKEFCALLSRMMEKDPNDRPSAAEMMKDVLFQDASKPDPMPNLRSQGDYGSKDYEAGGLNLNNFLRTIGDMSVAGRKRPQAQPKPPLKPKPRVAKPRDKAEPEEELTGDPVMDLVTRTLSSMGHNTLKPAGKNQMQHHVEMLRMYILRVLDNDRALFDRAVSELDSVADKDDLEEKLIRILGHERYGLCGVQLLHYKNFTYNIRT
ncbi:serine/threonine-protein kinase Nek4-like [Mya arenaria]|uniref:serine/threonine-protein kinase Nek4-like n=1 Tax=Mya arenaria TaxID=6604 RepID=UPI0022E64DDA|nr:serine/threonine-protein kinase Nek4-like [Mya arenaria]